MRILILVPAQPQATGNHATANRYRQGLAKLGYKVEVSEVQVHGPSVVGTVVKNFRPDLVHLLHAFRTGKPWLAFPLHQEFPFVVTLTGTDIHQGLASMQESPVIRTVLSEASSVILQNSITVEELRKKMPEITEKIAYLPPGIILGQEPYPLRRRHSIPPTRIVFLHPASIRAVKANLELLYLLDKVAAGGATFTAAFCGPILEEEYGSRFLTEVESRPWALYLGIIHPNAMPSVIRSSDILLNNSVSEGLPNALIEAAALGRPILARDIPGNAAIVQEDQNGYLYGDGDTFLRRANELISSPALCRRLSHPQPDRFDPDREAENLQTIYRRVLSCK